MLTLADNREKLYQWDRDVKLILKESDALNISEVHFASKLMTEAIPREIVRTNSETYVVIPNELLTHHYDIMAYLYIKDSNGNYTQCFKSFKVLPKPKPSNYYYYPEGEINSFLKRITTGEYPETTTISYERMSTIEASLTETRVVLTAKGVDSPEQFGINDIPQAVESIKTADEFKKLYENEKIRADEATERAGNAEKEVERLEDELEPLQESKRNFINLIDRSITSVDIPEGVIKIGFRAFNNCAHLTNVTFSDSVIEICEGALGSTALSNVKLGKNVKILAKDSFSHITNLQQVEFNNALETIEDGVFRYSGLTEAIFPNSLKKLNGAVFQGCLSLRKVYLPASLQVVNRYTFDSCSSLEEVYIEQGLTIRNTLNLQSSKNLSLESAENLLISLEDYSGTTNEFLNSIQFNASVWELLNAEGEVSPDGTSWEDYVETKGWNY